MQQVLQAIEAPTRITGPIVEATTTDVSIAPFVGAIVHYVIPDGPQRGQHRPAIIVRLWNENRANLQVFTDSVNDGGRYESGLTWAPSTQYSEVPTPGTWHWPC